MTCASRRIQWAPHPSRHVRRVGRWAAACWTSAFAISLLPGAARLLAIPAASVAYYLTLFDLDVPRVLLASRAARGFWRTDRGERRRLAWVGASTFATLASLMALLSWYPRSMLDSGPPGGLVGIAAFGATAFALLSVATRVRSFARASRGGAAFAATLDRASLARFESGTEGAWAASAILGIGFHYRASLVILAVGAAFALRGRAEGWIRRAWGVSHDSRAGFLTAAAGGGLRPGGAAPVVVAALSVLHVALNVPFAEPRPPDALVVGSSVGLAAVGIAVARHAAAGRLDASFATRAPVVLFVTVHVAWILAALAGGVESPFGRWSARAAEPFAGEAFAARTTALLSGLLAGALAAHATTWGTVRARITGDARAARAAITRSAIAHGTLAVELGDALRSWANPAGESAEHAHVELSIVEAALTGYAAHAGALLTDAEKHALPAGLETIALELASRFCTDALEERYFGWDSQRYASRGEHNLVRARSQLALAESVRASRAELAAIVERVFV